MHACMQYKVHWAKATCGRYTLVFLLALLEIKRAASLRNGALRACKDLICMPRARERLNVTFLASRRKDYCDIGIKRFIDQFPADRSA